MRAWCETHDAKGFCLDRTTAEHDGPPFGAVYERSFDARRCDARSIRGARADDLADGQ